MYCLNERQRMSWRWVCRTRNYLLRRKGAAWGNIFPRELLIVCIKYHHISMTTSIKYHPISLGYSVLHYLLKPYWSLHILSKCKALNRYFEKQRMKQKLLTEPQNVYSQGARILRFSEPSKEECNSSNILMQNENICCLSEIEIYLGILHMV